MPENCIAPKPEHNNNNTTHPEEGPPEMTETVLPIKTNELCVLFPGYLCILQLMFIVKFFMHAKIWFVTLVMRSIHGDYD